MSRNYKFHNPEGAYFVSFAVVEWIDVFTRNEYKDILLESLSFSQKNKAMEVFAWCIMTSHVHLVFRSAGEYKPEDLLGDIKRFTSSKIIRQLWKILKKAGKSGCLNNLKKLLSKVQM